MSRYVTRTLQCALALATASAVLHAAPAMRDYWPTSAWRTATPADLGLDAAKLDALRIHVSTTLPHLRSLAIVRRGHLVLEEYYQGLGPDDRHEVASVTKSVTSLVLGQAIAAGHLRLESPVADLFAPELTRSRSTAFAGVTLEHLLTMSGGFAWDENNHRAWLAAENQTAFTLALARAEPPGRAFRYNTPAMHLVSVALTRATQRTLSHYAREHLFAPLGIVDVAWPADRQGHSFAGHGLALRTRDLAKIGLLAASDGVWAERQLVPKSWMRAATARHSDGGPPENEAYGYLWWIARVHERDAFFAAGFGGQFLFVVPSEDLVVVITSNLDRPHLHNRTLITDFILPALR